MFELPKFARDARNEPQAIGNRLHVSQNHRLNHLEADVTQSYHDFSIPGRLQSAVLYPASTSQRSINLQLPVNGRQSLHDARWAPSIVCAVFHTRRSTDVILQ